ncbi:DNA-binding response regulator [Aerococcus agrisoli]|uniref:DNA-binding response regulator n=2 Tax=Aerococcus agrisoli TaxID=2487350 RepID=A0A3N4GRC2_9LACT|nr:DNA-binding response regulator [Aerococcus agrisoli]
MKVMLVEDDMVIARELAANLEKWQYQTYIVSDFDQVEADVVREAPHLILMDLNLPAYNGFYWTDRIRRQSKVPIIFISSVSEPMDMIMAMQMGADDYITKPIDMQLTISKIQALLRRTYDFADQSADQQFAFAGVRLQPTQSALTYQGQTIDLTFTELQILISLFRDAGQVVTRHSILDFCWQNDQFIDDNTLAVNMSRIRKKLRSIGLDDLIETKKNMGYRLVDPQATADNP